MDAALSSCGGDSRARRVSGTGCDVPPQTPRPGRPVGQIMAVRRWATRKRTRVSRTAFLQRGH
eukprot:6853990-Lingulodinium_polyedra.AAC.1